MVRDAYPNVVAWDRQEHPGYVGMPGLSCEIRPITYTISLAIKHLKDERLTLPKSYLGKVS